MEWIPVEKRLPEKGQTVLIRDANGEIAFGVAGEWHYCCKEGENRWFLEAPIDFEQPVFDCRCGECDTVIDADDTTHWAPIETPKKEELCWGDTSHD